MRSKANMLTNEEVENILKTSPNGTLALYGENGYPYSVPVNFVYSDGKIYFHGAAEGYKLDCMKKDPHVSFSVIGKDDIAKENFTTLFSSVIAFGTIRVIDTMEEKIPGIIAQGAFQPSLARIQKQRSQQSGRARMPRFLAEIRMNHFVGHVCEGGKGKRCE